MDEPLNFRVDLSPDQSTLLLPGSITISKTTVSVFKLCELADEEPLFIGVCSIPLLQFVRRRSGVNPSADALSLMSLSEHLFLNASLSAGIAPAREASASMRSTGTGIFPRTPREERAEGELQRLDNPAAWRSLRLEFPTRDACDRCVDALVARGAETMASGRGDTVSSSRATRDEAVYDDGASPKTRSVRADSRHPTESIASSRGGHAVSRPQEPSVATGVSDQMRSCISLPLEPSVSSQHGGEGLGRSQREGNGLPARSLASSSRREMDTPRQTSLPARSNPIHSYRELDSPRDPAAPSQRTPRDSTRESHRTPRDSVRDSQREPHASAYESQRTPKRFVRESQRTPKSSVRESQHTPKSSVRESQRTPTSSVRESRRDPPASTHESQRTPNNSVRRSQHTPRDSVRDSHHEPYVSARESQHTPRESQHTPRVSNRESGREPNASAPASHRSPRTPRDSTYASERDSPNRRREAQPAAHRAGQYNAVAPHRAQPAPPSQDYAQSERDSASVVELPYSHTKHDSNASVHTNTRPVQPRGLLSQPAQANSHPYGSTATPYSPNANSEMATTMRSRVNVRTEQQFFVRNVMKFMHHRLHFMQYLHKEMVHQAYLAEEARLFGGRGRNGTRGSGSRPTSVSPRSPRRTAGLSSVAEESARLREIEERLREVEVLHRDAERERAEATRLRRELERQLSATSAATSVPRTGRVRSASHDVSELNEYNPSLRSFRGSPQVAPEPSPGVRGTAYNDNELIASTTGVGNTLSPTQRGQQSGSYSANRLSQSVVMMSNGQLATLVPVSQQQLQVQPDAPRVEEVDYTTAIMDRYIYGDEWHLVYPSRAADVRFNALIDICLTLKIPRRLVTITHLSLDQPGLRVTAEIRHDRDALPRELLERRFANQPFRFLHRFYDLRHCYANGSDYTTHTMSGSGGNVMRSARRLSRATTPRSVARRTSQSHSHPPVLEEEFTPSSEFGAIEEDFLEDVLDVDSVMRELQRRTEESGRRRQQELERERARKRQRMLREQEQDMRVLLVQLEREEGLRRSRLTLGEAQERQSLTFDASLNHRHSFAVGKHAMEEQENLDRAMIEVGHARQAQALAQAHRRSLALLRLCLSESDRRGRILAQERDAFAVLDLVMHPSRHHGDGPFAQLLNDEHARRRRLAEAEAKQRVGLYDTQRGFLADALRDALDGLLGDEQTARVVLAADEMRGRIDLVCAAQGVGGPGGATQRAFGVSPQAWQALMAEEAAEREHLLHDEARRRRLFRREYIVTTEDLTRDAIELEELDEHITLIDNMVHRNRAMLERRMEERKQAAKVVNEEQYYRKSVLTDEQDVWEMLMELFDSELHDVLLAEATRLSSAPDLESPQRRRRPTGTPRQTKPFHYMTFIPEDMDHLPSANLAIEGILGCSINKNLEVTSIARPLPKVEEEELQFQAGDMILDVAGYSLHSLSHLREVLANRAMQIQSEAREEFPDVVEEELTLNPALQKYIEVLCEHHNFLVQVLRGCDIFQIIVKS